MLRRLEQARARRRISPAAGAGADTLPQIGHIVVLMMENHSYDNYLGMLDRGGGGFPLGPDGQPAGSNLTSAGLEVALQHAPSVTQVPQLPTQSWNASHIQWHDGVCDGFVRSIEETLPSLDATVPMHYWTEAELPFYYGLARTFPLATRWFGSCLGPTFPNRRFMVSGTAHGLVDDITFGMVDYPAAGTIFDHLSAHAISWVNYHHLPAATANWRRISRTRGAAYLRLLGGAIAGIFPRLHSSLESKIQVTAALYPLDFVRSVNHLRPITDFFTAAQAGALPAVSIVDPDFDATSEENPQDIQAGEEFAASVINAVMSGPGWPYTLLIWLYDEHGGYYDHVSPPAAVAPDDVAARGLYEKFPLLRLLRRTSFGRKLTAADSGPRTYTRLGFRVPAVIVSPYAKPDHVMQQDFEHTAILKLIQRKWSLPSLTHRDAAAADLLDALDLDGPGAFMTPPELPKPARAQSAT